MDNSEVKILFLLFIIILIILVGIMVGLIVFIQKRKIQYIINQQKNKLILEKELQQSKIEITEQTFRDIAWELHDNIGQIISVANMHIKFQLAETDCMSDKLEEASALLSQSLTEIRNLSKALNYDAIKDLGLLSSVEKEIDRFRRLKQYEADLIVNGEEQRIDNNTELILFRIIQEFLSNSIKHSHADKIEVIFDYSPKKLQIKILENGKGFDKNQISLGSGMANMRERAKLIKADLKISSKIGMGTTLSLNYAL